MNKISLERIAKEFGCTIQQMADQYSKNAATFRKFADIASSKKRKIYHGLSQGAWMEKAIEFETIAANHK